MGVDIAEPLANETASILFKDGNGHTKYHYWFYLNLKGWRSVTISCRYEIFTNKNQQDLRRGGTRGVLAICEREWFCWPNRPNAVRITLDGIWKINELVRAMETVDHQPQIIASANGEIVIEIVCRESLSAEILLSK